MAGALQLMFLFGAWLCGWALIWWTPSRLRQRWLRVTLRTALVVVFVALLTFAGLFIGLCQYTGIVTTGDLTSGWALLAGTVIGGAALVTRPWWRGRVAGAELPAGRSRRITPLLSAGLLVCMALHGLFLSIAASAGDAVVQACRAANQMELDAHLPPVAQGSATQADAATLIDQLENDNFDGDIKDGGVVSDWNVQFWVANQQDRQPWDTTRVHSYFTPKAMMSLPDFVDRMGRYRGRILACAQAPVWRYGTLGDDDIAAVADGVTSPPGSISAAQNLAYYLAVDAAVRIGRKEYPQALEDLDAIHRLAELVGRRRNGDIGFLVATALEGIAQRDEEELLAAPDLPEPLLRGWQIGGPRTLQQRAADSVFAAQNYTFHYLEKFAHNDPPEGDLFGGGRITWRTRNAWSSAWLRAYILPTAVPVIATSAQEAESRLLKPHFQAYPPGVEWTPPYAREKTRFVARLMPKSDAWAAHAAMADAFIDLLRVGRAAELYRRKNGKYPAALAALVPEFLPAVPTDPFDGQPVRMRPVEGGLILYSVGYNGVDDHGARDYSKGVSDWEDKDITLYLGAALTADFAAYRAAWHAANPGKP